MLSNVALFWGAHGAGKTFFLERLENLYFRKFLPIFGDLYGAKLEQPEKLRLMLEAYRFPGTVLIEGKRFVDNSLLQCFEDYAEDFYTRKQSTLVIPYMSVAASEARINERRVKRAVKGGKEETDVNPFVYPERRAEYETADRFKRKLMSLYQNQPLKWSSVDLHHILVDDVAEWMPLRTFFEEQFSAMPDIDLQELAKYPVLTYFWNRRLDTLKEKGQGYFNWRIEDDSPYRLPSTEFLGQPLPAELLDTHARVELTRKTRKAFKFSVNTPASDGPDAHTDEPSPDGEVPSTVPVSPTAQPSLTNMSAKIAIVPAACEASKTELSKVRRGLKKLGFDQGVLSDADVSTLVGGFRSASVDIAKKSSEWIGKCAIDSANAIVSARPAAAAQSA